MSNHYDARYIERIETDQPSSAGMPTQHLTTPPAGPISSVPRRSNNQMAGIALIAVGVLLALGRLAPDPGAITAGMILLTISSPFFFVAFWRRLYPFLIPACILAGLSVGVPLAELTNGVSVLWGLSLGFLAIFVLGRSLFNVRVPWPIFPAIPLFVIGVIVAIASLPAFLGLGMMWFPVLLIAAGLYLGSRRRGP